MEISKTTQKPGILHVETLVSDVAIRSEDPHTAALEDSPDHAQRPSVATLLAIFSLALMAPATVTMPAVLGAGLLFDIGAALGHEGDSLWQLNAWSIAGAVTALIGGHFSDIFGRRYVILSGQVLSVIGAIVGASATKIGAALAGMTMLGLGAGVLGSVYTGIPELVPFRYRGLSLAFLELVLCVPWVAPSVLICRLLYVEATWRWIYIISAIYGSLSFVGTVIFYWPPSRNRGDLEKSRMQQFLDLDFVGLVLYICGLTVLMIGLAWGGSTGHSWASTSVIAPIVIGAVLLIACFAYDMTMCPADKAMFPPNLLKRFREYSLVLISTFVAGMIYYSMSALLPRGTELLYTTDPIRVGIYSLPNGCAQTLGPLIMPAIMHYTKHPKWHLVVAVTLQGVFTALMAYAAMDHVGAWIGLQVFVQGCFPWTIIAATVNTSLHVEHSKLGVAIGVLITFRAIGGSVGTAILGSVIASEVNKNLGSKIAEAALSLVFPVKELSQLIPAAIQNAMGVADAFAKLPVVTPAIAEATKTAFHQVYGHAYQVMFYVTIPFSMTAVVAMLFVKDSSDYLTNHTAVLLERDVLSKQTRATQAHQSIQDKSGD